jgi:uncharacterized membrane protein YjjP (DUF1212 family)
MEAAAVQVDEIAHLALQVGRLLLLNGADTEQVQEAVARFAAAFGGEAHLMVSYEALLITVLNNHNFRTRIGHRLPGMNVGMSAVAALNQLIDDVEAGRLSQTDAAATLTAIERAPPTYPRWLVVAGLGLTAASLSRLFGGDWGTFAIAGMAGLLATWLRLALAARRVNPVLVSFAVALFGGVIGGIAVRLGVSGTPALCLVAPAMILVPGVPLINGVQDMIRNHVTLGMSRLGFATLVVAAIGLGLFAATMLTGVRIAIDAPTVAIGAPEDAVFSALAAGGYALLFSVPARLAWACAVCGVASHTLRAMLFHMGIDIIAGTLIGALAAGCLAQVFARRFHAPAAAFAFPGVVAMIPGAYAFRAVLGALAIAQGNAAAPVVNDTLALVITVFLMVGGIAVGIAAPILLASPLRGAHLTRDGA